MGETDDYDEDGMPAAHHTTHEDGGDDEVNVQGLNGTLADAQPSTWTLVSGKPSTFPPEAHKASHEAGGGDPLTALLRAIITDFFSSPFWASIPDKPSSFTPSAHKTSHQDGGSDEISVQGLSGTLADAQTPSAHKTSHQDGGSDEISVTALSGLLADAQKITVRKNTGADVGTRKRLNLIEGTNVTLTVVDDATGDEVDVTVAATGGVTSEGEGHITWLPTTYSSVTQGSWALTLSASAFLYGYLYNVTGAQNDQIDYKIYLAAGTYTFYVLGHKTSTSAILTLLFDGVSQGTIDFYNATTTYNNALMITGIVVSTAGLKTVSFKAATKNPSSGGYNLSISYSALYRTA